MEKKTVKASLSPPLEDTLSAKQDEGLKTVTTEASTEILCLEQYAQDKEMF